MFNRFNLPDHFLRKAYHLLFLVLTVGTISAQTTAAVYFEDWVKSGGVSSETQNELLNRVATTTDISGNLYVASAALNNTTQVHDLFVKKYNSLGTLLWSNQFNISNGGDVLVGNLTLDGSGNLLIAGTVLNGANNYDALTVKYSSSGTLVWSRTWNSSLNGYDGCAALTTDPSGNVYVTGVTTSGTAFSNFLTLKYSASGTLSWAVQYDQAGLIDAAARIVYNSSGYVIVTGAVQINSSTWSLAGIRYSASNGAQVNSAILSGNIVFSELGGFTTDMYNNIYIAGARNSGTLNNYDFLTLKLDANLNVLWEATYDGSGGKDVARAVGVDAGGNVYVTGYTTASDGTGQNYMTLKYSPSGVFQWKKTYNGAINQDDQATDILVNNSGDILVTGFAKEKSSDDFLTIWYDPAGNQKWTGRFNSDYNRQDKASTLQSDGNGGFLVTGRTQVITAQGGLGTTVTTVRYGRGCNYITPPDDELQSSSIVFVKNKGQLVKTDMSPAPEVLYYTDANATSLNFQSDKICFVAGRDSGGAIGYHRVDMAFGGEGRSRNLFALEERPDYFNFYLPQVPQGREMVPLYKRLVYCGIFPGVDLMLSTNGTGVKYYYIVEPRADPGVIQMIFSGQTSLAVAGGNLVMGTQLGDIVIPRGIAYEVDHSGNAIPLSWVPDFILNGNAQSFYFEKYNSDNYLVFQLNFDACMDDVSVVDNNDWATFYSGNNFSKDFLDVKTDNSNNSFATGFTTDEAFPVQNGFQSVLNQFQDAFLVKFDNSAVRKFATYFGGEGSEEANAMETDNDGNSYIVGGTSSKTAFPLFNNGTAFFDGVNTCDGLLGCRDAFIASFDPAGLRRFATFFGGKEADEAYDIKRNHKGEFYVVGSGTAAVPPVGAPFEQTNGLSFIARFSANFAPIWSSTYGGDVINSVGFDPNDNVFITGATHNNSSLAIFGPKPNSLVRAHADDMIDGFVAKITDNPIDLVWSTYYGGSAGDRFRRLVVDQEANVYIVGYIEAGSDIPTYNPGIPGAIFHSTGLGDEDGFLAKFNTDGVPLYGSFLGGSGRDEAYDIEIDAFQNIYISGVTRDGIIDGTKAHGNYYYQSTKMGLDDEFIVGLNRLFRPIWITYHGGSDGKRISSTTLSSNNFLYTAGIMFAYGFPSPDYPLEDFDGNSLNVSYFQCTYGDGNNTVLGGTFARFLLSPMVPTQEVEGTGSADMRIAPNPAQNSITVSCPALSENDDCVIQIFDLTGALRSEFRGRIGDADNTLDISALDNGVYFLKLFMPASERFLAGKLVVQR